MMMSLLNIWTALLMAIYNFTEDDDDDSGIDSFNYVDVYDEVWLLDKNLFLFTKGKVK